MFVYEKQLQYPVKIKNPNPALAKIIASQYGGPDGELGASTRYLSQRFAMPMPELKATLTDIGTEELNHLEMVGAIIYQLTKGVSPEEIKKAGLDAYFVDHTTGVYPASAAGVPFNAFSIASKGDAITDLHESMAAEQGISEAPQLCYISQNDTEIHGLGVVFYYVLNYKEESKNVNTQDG